MFKDAKQELERLESQLLMEEETQEKPEEIPQVSCYNTDRSDVDLDELTDQLNTPSSRSLTGFAVFMVIVTLVLLGLLGWWLVHRGGIL